MLKNYILGEVVHLLALGKNIMIINSDKVANDLLDKRGTIYSDRPYHPIHEMCVLSFVSLPLVAEILTPL